MSSAEAEVKPIPLPETAPEENAVPPSAQHDSHDEEYESADDAYEEEEIEEIEEEEVEEEEYDEERSASQQEKKELDDDEDAKNPQFIPKRGYFYEHDDRTKTDDEAEIEEPTKEEKLEKKPEKVIKPKPEADRWSHDLFNESDQAPKSKEELSRAYGYDIFTDDQAPRARRRRRYGRGPNKYTRHWEEEEAYQRPRGGGGFRGVRGGRGRGNAPRGGYRHGGEHDNRTEEQEEEFPALPGSTVAEKSVTKEQQPSKPTMANKVDPHHNPVGGDRRGSGEKSHPPAPAQSQDVRKRYNEYNNDYAPRGNSRGGGGVGGRGGMRGRRNEFSNRNRYPNRRDGENEEQSGGPEYSERERPSNRPRPERANYSQDVRNNKGPPPHPTTNGHAKDARPKDGPLPSKPPFSTNTEYTGSHSLTATRKQQDERKPQQQQQPPQQSNILAEKGVTDLREVINQKRMQQQQQQPQQNQGDKRNQIPPRMQQQQNQPPQHQQNIQQSQKVSQHHNQPPPPQHHNQPPPPQHHNQQQQHGGNEQSKPKRFSQRQRQTDLPPGNGGGNVSSSGHHPPNSNMGHAPNMIPVVSGAGDMVPSGVAYPQAPAYYEGPQVYESSGSPVTVATVSTNGASVSPSLWTQHAYATNAPYPSPPTGPQVPGAAYAPDHAAYIAAQQVQAPIYSGPPPYIQDPLLNYNPAPPFAPPYHPQGYQGYPPVVNQTPAPPPELYHGGVTYYNPQPQIQRQPLMSHKRTKTVLQLVEPPEKNKGGHHHHPHHNRHHHPQQQHHQQYDQQHSQSPPIYNSSSSASAADSQVHGHIEPSELVQQFEHVSLAEPVPQEAMEQIRKPSPLPEQESWSAQMEEMNSPSEEPPSKPTPAKEEPSHKAEPINEEVVVSEAAVKSDSPQPTKQDSDDSKKEESTEK